MPAPPTLQHSSPQQPDEQQLAYATALQSLTSTDDYNAHLKGDLFRKREETQRRAEDDQRHRHEPLVLILGTALVLVAAVEPRQKPASPSTSEGGQRQIHITTSTGGLSIFVILCVAERMSLAEECLMAKDLIRMNTRGPCTAVDR